MLVRSSACDGADSFPLVTAGEARLGSGEPFEHCGSRESCGCAVLRFQHPGFDGGRAALLIQIADQFETRCTSAAGPLWRADCGCRGRR